jgi:hypothetical protein
MSGSEEGSTDTGPFHTVVVLNGRMTQHDGQVSQTLENERASELWLVCC